MTFSPMPSSPHDRTDVALLRWPEQAGERSAVARAGRPRLLLIAPGSAPPEVDARFEDWLREPADPVDVLARLELLRDRARRDPRPVLDDDGLLRCDGRWVAVPHAQLGIVRLLLADFGGLVRTDDLRATYVDAGGSGEPASIRSLVNRLGTRVATVGLSLHSVRGRGVILDRAGRD